MLRDDPSGIAQWILPAAYAGHLNCVWCLGPAKRSLNHPKPLIIQEKKVLHFSVSLIIFFMKHLEGGYDLRGRNRLLMGTTMFMLVMPWLRLKHHIGMPAVREVVLQGMSSRIHWRPKENDQKAFLEVPSFFAKTSRVPSLDIVK